MAAGDGLVSMTPTSIAYSGTSASINADGGVDFTTVTSLSLNGVFTSTHDNYVFFITLSSAVDLGANFRLRASGSDATGSDYSAQRFDADGSSVIGARYTSRNYMYDLASASVTVNAYAMYLYGPALAQKTVTRTVSRRGTNSAHINDYVGSHALSTSYDGFTLYAGNAFTGNIHVFGYEE